MNRTQLKKVFFQAMAWLALVVLCGAVALAQDAAPAATSPAASAARSDGQIEIDVVHALDTSKALKSDLITAATIQGEVTLSGTVSSEASRELAETIVSRVAGVTKVNNNLTGRQSAVAGTAARPQPAQRRGNSQLRGQRGAPAMNDGPMPVPNETPGQAQLRAEIRAEVRAQLRRSASMAQTQNATFRLRRMKRPRARLPSPRERCCSCGPVSR